MVACSNAGVIIITLLFNVFCSISLCVFCCNSFVLICSCFLMLSNFVSDTLIKSVICLIVFTFFYWLQPTSIETLKLWIRIIFLTSNIFDIEEKKTYSIYVSNKIDFEKFILSTYTLSNWYYCYVYKGCAW